MTQELFNRLTLTGEWYHNRFTDITERNNVARNFDSYTPVDVVSPLDGKVITMYNVKTEFASAVQNVDASDSDIKRHYNGFELGFNARLPRGARIFGGFNLEKTLADTCSNGTDPNFTLYCNQWDSGIPWAKQFKLAGTYPAAVVGADRQRLAAEPDGLRGRHAGDSLRRVHLRHRLRRAERPGHVLAGDPHDASTRPTARRRAVPDELVIPGLNVASLNVPLRAPETEFMPRYNQFDLSFSKTLTVRGIRIMPKLDIFNVMNSDRWSTVTTAQFGAATYLQPSTIMQARLYPHRHRDELVDIRGASGLGLSGCPGLDTARPEGRAVHGPPFRRLWRCRPGPLPLVTGPGTHGHGPSAADPGAILEAAMSAVRATSLVAAALLLILAAARPSVARQTRGLSDLDGRPVDPLAGVGTGLGARLHRRRLSDLRPLRTRGAAARREIPGRRHRRLAGLRQRR